MNESSMHQETIRSYITLGIPESRAKDKDLDAGSLRGGPESRRDGTEKVRQKKQPMECV